MTDVDRDFLANQKGEEGNKLYYAKDYNGAIKLFNEAIELKPNYAEAYKYDLAIKDLDKVKELNPDDKLNELTKVIRDIIDMKRDITPTDNSKSYNPLIQKIEKYTKAIEHVPNNFLNYMQRASIYNQLGDYKSALKDANKVIELEPNHGNNYYLS